MQGLGFGLAMSALARKCKLSGEILKAFLQRNTAFFNSHPIMSSYALGAVSRLELEDKPGEEIAELKNNLIGPLGLLGDQIFWSRLKPLMATLLVLFLLFLNYPISAANRGVDLLALGLFFTLFNIIQFWVRWRGLKAGFRCGANVIEEITKSRLVRFRLHLAWVFAFSAGILFLVANEKLKHPWIFFATFASAFICLRTKLPIWSAFLFSLAVFLLVSLISSVTL
jgi:PTS system mannose-specific IID component